MTTPTTPVLLGTSAFFQEKEGITAAAQIRAFNTLEWKHDCRAAYDALSLRTDRLGSVIRACVQLQDLPRPIQKKRRRAFSACSKIRVSARTFNET